MMSAIAAPRSCHIVWFARPFVRPHTLVRKVYVQPQLPLPRSPLLTCHGCPPGGRLGPGCSEDARWRAAARRSRPRPAALGDLTRVWLINYGTKGGALFPRTLERYRRPLLAPDPDRPRSLSPTAALLEAGKQEDLLHPSRMAATRWLHAWRPPAPSPPSSR